MKDFTETAVLPDNAFAKRLKKPRDAELDTPAKDFDKTVVLEDEVAKRRLSQPPRR